MPQASVKEVKYSGSASVDHETVTQQNQHLKDLSEFEKLKTPEYGSITLGHVYGVIPYTGIHAIIIAGQGNTKVFGTASYIGSNRISGIRTPQVFLPGTTVVLLVRGEKADLRLPKYIIIGAVDAIELDGGNRHVFDLPTETFLHSGGFSSSRPDGGFIFTTTKDPYQKKDFSYGKPIDGFAGEHSSLNVMGNGFFANDFMAAVKGSDHAKVETFLFDNTVRITADHYELSNAMYEKRMFFNRFGVSTISRTASTLYEGLGSIDGNAHLQTFDSVLPEAKQGIVQPDSTEARIGFFSHQKLIGNLADGKMELITLPPKDTTYKQDSTLAPGLLSLEENYDGCFRVKAAREISLEKTMYIVAPKEYTPTDRNTGEVDFTRKEWDQEKNVLEEEGILAGRQFLDAYEEFNKDNSLVDMHKQPECWVVPDKKAVYDAFNAATGGSFQPEFKLDKLDSQQPHYPAPARKVSVQPYTEEGKRKGDYTIYDTSSGIKHLPDGSVVIYGGNGEEIRMFRGNIYFTCPGDIIYQGGRDIISMAPRSNIVKAGNGTLELSSQNTASLVSNGNLQLCAAASGTNLGTLLIENKSMGDFTMSPYDTGGLENNASKGGGIVLKSKTRTMLLGPYTYLGGGDSWAGSVLELDYQDTEFHSDAHKHYIQTTSSILSKEGAAFTVAGSGIEALASSIAFGTSAFLCIPTNRDIPYYDRDGKEINVPISASDVSVQIRGNMILSDGLTCSGVSTPSGGQLARNVLFGRDVARIPKEANFNTYLNERNDRGLGALLDTLNIALADLSKIGLILPSTLAYKANNFYFPMATWQAILSGGGTWAEMAVPGSMGFTMTFPGRDRWGQDGSMRSFNTASGDMEDKTLGSDYATNT